MPATDDLINGRAELLDASGGYVEANEFYDGDCEEVFASVKARKLLQKHGATSVEDFNYAHIPVDAVAEKLQIISLAAVVGDPEEEEDAEDKAAQDALDWLVEINQLDAETPNHILRTCKHGDAYALVVRKKDGEGKDVGVDIRYNSAETVRMIYSAEDPLEPAYVIKMWEINAAQKDKKQIRVNLYYADRTERWITEPGKGGDDPKDWVPYNDDELGQPLDPADEQGLPVIPNPEGRIPWFHYRNDRPYGRPEHANAYGPQQLLNKLVSAHAVTIDFQSFPQRYALVDPKLDQVMQNLVDPNYPEDEDDDPESEHNATQLKADPSAVWRLFGVSQVGQFAVAQPEVFLSPFDRYVKAMSEVTGCPLYRFGGSFAQPPSGEALRRIDAPLNTRADHLQKLLGATHKDMLEYALSLMGIEATVQITWAPLQQVTDAEGWGVVGTKIANGVPPEQALVEAGYERDQVKKWLDEPGNNEMLRRIAVLGQLGDAASKLGTAAGMGVISLEQIGKAIQWVLGAAFVGGDPEDYAEPPAELFKEVDIQPPQPVAMQQDQLDHQAEQADLGRQQAAEIAAAGPPAPPSTGRQPQPAGR